jgi:hypothetical protein
MVDEGAKVLIGRERAGRMGKPGHWNKKISKRRALRQP